MTSMQIAAAVLVTCASGAYAQAPSQSAPPTSPASATTTIEQDKRGAAAPIPAQRSASTRPGAAPPMNIRIQGEGIKLPACTAESREGEACKK